MKRVKVLGMGCPKCNMLEDKVKQVAESNDIPIMLEKIKDLPTIQKYGIMITPALVIEEKVRAYGRIPKDEEILKWLTEA